jgi:hypothetical protein
MLQVLSPKVLALLSLTLLTLGLRAYEFQAGDHIIQEGSLELLTRSGDIVGVKVDQAGASILRLNAAPIRSSGRCVLVSRLIA